MGHTEGMFTLEGDWSSISRKEDCAIWCYRCFSRISCSLSCKASQCTWWKLVLPWPPSKHTPSKHTPSLPSRPPPHLQKALAISLPWWMEMWKCRGTSSFKMSHVVQHTSLARYSELSRFSESELLSLYSGSIFRTFLLHSSGVLRCSPNSPISGDSQLNKVTCILYTG